VVWVGLMCGCILGLGLPRMHEFFCCQVFMGNKLSKLRHGIIQTGQGNLVVVWVGLMCGCILGLGLPRMHEFVVCGVYLGTNTCKLRHGKGQTGASYSDNDR